MILNMDFKPVISISPGDEVLCPGFFGDFLKLTMKSSVVGESVGGMIVLIKYDETNKSFIPYAFLDSRRIKEIDFG